MKTKLLFLLLCICIHGFAQQNENSRKYRLQANQATTGFTGTSSIQVSSSLQTNNPRTRSFSYHLPVNAPDCNRPLLIVLHGDGGTGAGIQSYTGFDAIADAQNFLVTYPDAASTIWGFQFNKYADNVAGFAGIPDPNAADDVQYISDLIDYFFNTYGIDRSRVYVTGHSGGAFMAYHLILADLTKTKIAAIAPVAASVWGDGPFINAQTTVANYSPTAIMHLHCPSDPTVTFPAVGATYTWPLSIFSTPACGNPAPVTTVINAEVDRLSYCPSGNKIELIKLKRASLGHGWPTTANSNFNGAGEIWSFLSANSKGTYAGTLPNPTVSPFALTITSAQTVILTASGCPATSSYLWKQGGATVGTTASFTSPLLSASTTYTAFCNTATCQSAGQNVAITFSNGPLIPIIDNHIKIDQIGYRPSDKKIAVITQAQVGFNAPDVFVPTTVANQYQVRRLVDDVAVFTGTATVWNSGVINSQSGDKAWWFDFSTVNTPGDYYVYDLGLNRRSYTFSIANDIYANLTKQAIKALYYQRCGVAKTAAFGGIWNDTACHTHGEQDTDCRAGGNPVAATSKDLSGGWHDAGDYNKYVLLAHPAVDGLLFAYEEKPTFWGDDSNIPESGNQIPDILDELKIELDWLLKMQQPDGSVLSKVSVMSYSEGSPASSSMVARRYAPANTASALSFAAMLAHASLVYRSFPVMQTYANTLKTAAINAFSWALANPNVTFDNTGYASAGVNGSAYDRDYALKISAAIYLFALTNNVTYKTFIDANHTNINMMNFVYEYEGNTQDAMLYYAHLPTATPAISTAIKNAYKNGIDLGSNNLPTFTNLNQDPYRAYTNFYSFNNNHFKAFKGLMYQNSLKYKLNTTNNQLYTDASLTFLNYLHGVNPIAKTYVSNISSLNAENSVNEIYHTWFGDGTIYDGTISPKIGPPPGFLVCGADQSYLSDGGSAIYNPPANQPAAKSYLDFNTSAAASWVTSEIAIYNQATYTRLLEKFVTQPTAVNNVTYCLPTTNGPGLELTGLTLGGQILSQNTGYAENGYALYAKNAPLLVAGNTYSYTSTKVSSAFHIESIHIDLNRDGDFDDGGEFVGLASVNNTSHSGIIMIPMVLSNGFTRLRFKLSTNSSSPCASQLNIGETEDYVVEISNCGIIPPPLTAVSNPNPAPFGSESTLTATGCSAGSNYVWLKNGITQSNQPTFNSQTLLSSSTFTAFCESGGCLSAGLNVIINVSPSTDCPDIRSLNGAISPPPFVSNSVRAAKNFVNIGSQASQWILNGSNTDKISVLAGKSIEINPGVSILNGTVFKAEIANCANIPQTLFVQGKNLYDSQSQPLVLRGVNYSVMDDWGFPATDLISEIEKSGANTIRLQWYKTYAARPAYTATDLDNLLTKCKTNRIIPILELHDITCQADANLINTQLISWWTDPAIVTVLNKHKKYLIINLANEVGRYRWAGYSPASLANWKDAYKTAITSIRNAGLNMPIMIDAPDCGTDIRAIVDGGQEIITHDPQGNIIFSVHSYWAGYNGFSDLTNAINANLPIVFGEVANKQDDTVNGANSFCHYNIDGTTTEPNNPTNGFQYQTLLNTLKTNNIGWLAWAWTRDGCPARNMTSNNATAPYGGFNTLTTFGNDIVNNPNYGLLLHAVRAGLGAF